MKQQKMKKIIGLIGIVLIGIFGCYPKASAQPISVDTTGLPSNVKEAIIQKIQSDEVTRKIETYGKWAGMGKEIGIAAKEGLTSVKDFAVDISNSNVGKTVLFLIIWKVAGKDFVRIILGTIFAIISIWLLSRSYFRMFATRKLIESSGFFLWRTKKYENIKVPDPVLDGIPNSWAAGLHWFFLCIMILASAIIAFG